MNEFLLIINGVIPEAMPFIAYRRTGRAELESRKIIKCPHCREAFTDVDRHTSVQIFRRKNGKSKTHTRHPGQIFKMCNACKNEIGIIINVNGVAV